MIYEGISGLSIITLISRYARKNGNNKNMIDTTATDAK